MKTPTILLYHQISVLTDALDPYGISVTPDNFAAQMQYLADNDYTVMKLSDAIKQMRKDDSALPDKCVVITFDDGYRDNMTNALPILEKHSFPATIFTVADHVGKFAVWDGDIGAQMPLLTWDEMRDMLPHGIEFGSHTCTHVHLPDMDDDVVEREVRTSKRIIEDHLGVAVETLAYPYEEFNQTSLMMTERAGYLAACGTWRMPETFYNLWRVEIGKADTLGRFQNKISRLYKPYTRLKKNIKDWLR
ncbi:MAG: polysaccharide deacetylase family protein [Chloroflexota bacterium]